MTPPPGEPSWPWSYGSRIYNCLCKRCLSPLMLWVRISIRARCTTLCDNVCHWLATGRWFSPGPPVSSTNKTDRHNIAAILLKVVLSTIKQTNLLLSYLSRSLFCLPISPLTFPMPQSYFQVYRFEYFWPEFHELHKIWKSHK